MQSARDSARGASVWLLALLVVLPAVNAALVAWSFHVLMARFGRVPLSDMLALIGSAWLLNYLPMRPGLIGRLAYHKAVHKVGFRQSVAVSVALALMTGLAAAHVLGAWIAFRAGVPVGITVSIASVILVVLAANIAADRSPAGAVPRGALRVALVLRYADLAVWSMRLVVAFEVIGQPIPIMVGVLLASVIQLAYLFPLTGSGLGVSEWAVAVVAPLAIAIDPPAAIAASLLGRVGELIAAVPAGLIGSAYIARRRRGSRSGHARRQSTKSVQQADNDPNR